MDIPPILNPLRHVVAVPAAPDRNLAFIAPVADANPLPIVLEPQALSNWCWAAVTSSVENFYQEAYAASQCEVATRCLPWPCCPPGPDTGTNPLNVTYNLQTALNQNANPPAIGGQISYSDLQAEISLGRPICFVVHWDAGGAHVLLAVGWSGSGDVWIDDPAAPGLRAIPWERFCQLYGDDGYWQATLKTKHS